MITGQLHTNDVILGIDAPVNMNAAHLKGAANELQAQQWFLENDYQVFTPVVQQGIADFVRLKDGTFAKVQVKTAHYVTSSGIKYLQVRLGRSSTGGRSTTTRAYLDREEDRFDILFVVYENQMWFIPTSELPAGKKTVYFDTKGKRSGWCADKFKV